MFPQAGRGVKERRRKKEEEARRQAQLPGLKRGEISDIIREEAFAGDLEDAIAIILGEQTRRSEQLFAEGTPLRQRAQGTLLDQLAAGPLETPDVSGLADVANPFRSRFSADLKLRPHSEVKGAHARDVAEQAKKLFQRRRKKKTPTGGTTTPSGGLGGKPTNGTPIRR